VKYVGLDWAYRTVQWCALAPGGEIAGEGRIATDREGSPGSSSNWAMR
jgi:hypothetical protein